MCACGVQHVSQPYTMPRRTSRKPTQNTAIRVVSGYIQVYFSEVSQKVEPFRGQMWKVEIVFLIGLLCSIKTIVWVSTSSLDVVCNENNCWRASVAHIASSFEDTLGSTRVFEEANRL